MRETLTGVPDGLAPLVLARLGEDASAGSPPLLLHVARDDRRLEALAEGLAFFAPGVRVIQMPAWDTVPYDRIGPNAEIVATRVASMARLAAAARKGPTVVLTTVNSILQRLPPREFIRRSLKTIAPGQRIDMNQLVQRLNLAGFQRTGTVMEAGEFAIRGGILDLFPPGRLSPVRLDFFGDTLEHIKAFDPETQRTAKIVQRLTLMPISEVAFGGEAEKRFRTKYVETFGPAASEDALYEAVSAGQRYPGMEHWLPLFHEHLETLFDYVPDAPVSFDHLADQAVEERLALIADHYDARVKGLEALAFGAPPYKPVPAAAMFLTAEEWAERLASRTTRHMSPFEEASTSFPRSASESGNPTARGTSGAGFPLSASVGGNDAGGQQGRVYSFGGRVGRNFALERAGEGGNVFTAAVQHAKNLQAQGKRVIVASFSQGARERLFTLLAEHDLTNARKVESFAAAAALPADAAAFAVLGIEQGFETPNLAVIGEQDVLGDRLVRPRRKARRASDVITEATSLGVGDYVVHTEHGIGRFDGLTTITALGAPHDCLEIAYAEGAKLYLPVENIELLSRYGSADGVVQLDRLGGVAWQTRKARLKQRIREMASELIKVAAMRQLREAPVMVPPEGAFDEFVARFPYGETEDQTSSIGNVLEDLGSGKPMDRLVCGDVGFGKTEVALRAAFVAAMDGFQVAVVVPTTLLARQHFATFSERFKGLPVHIAQASRLIAAKDLNAVKAGIKEGNIDIVVGTHALLGKSIGFKRLGLVIVDEEQHFGVAHKERLKQLREDVHVLTLTATPIPRTLQLALTGVRELSLITTPPVDRLAVRTYISPFDPVIIREALRRERYRGGQTFYVAPRISDLEDVGEFLAESVPELRVARAHGQLPPSQLEDVMTAFYDGKYDVLLSTAIVESGLDIPNANTLIVHRADMFGLAQLYQLRGRVGRSKTRAYAYFTTPANQRLTEGAEKRLKVLQSLDTLGAGFSLASHDMDIRGAGNLLGEEQSGHINEVGFELYQSMLEEAVAALKGGDLGETQEQWSPQISLGTAVLIPETYVGDLQLRLGLYRRLSTLEKRADIDNFAAELVDRFGELPDEVRHLLDIVEIKGLARVGGLQQVDAGPKGAVIVFRKNQFANPEGLVAFMQKSRGGVRMQPDHKLVFKADWPQPEDRLRGVRTLVRQLAEIAGSPRKAA
jgi:transcription-repair coupling factor (superfamily II helicase)